MGGCANPTTKTGGRKNLILKKFRKKRGGKKTVRPSGPKQGERGGGVVLRGGEASSNQKTGRVEKNPATSLKLWGARGARVQVYRPQGVFKEKKNEF